MKRLARLILVPLVTALLGLGVLVASFEVMCGTGGGGIDSGVPASAPFEAILHPPGDTRPEAQSWLTYPEWHIVYSAEAFASTLEHARPSAFPYGRDVSGFWTSYCAVNRATEGMSNRTAYKVTIYTIGISYTGELAIKATYEWTIGRLFELAFGAESGPDRYSAAIQAEYAAFLHETPWYEFPFGRALSDLWAVQDDGQRVRAWERRIVLSMEYGAKALYSKVIGAAVGMSGHDERTMRLVARGTPASVAAVDPRLTVVGEPRPGLVIAEVPRYEQFTELTRALARSEVGLVEIAGNDDIFVTAIVPTGSAGAGIDGDALRLFALGTDGHDGFERAGLTVKVPELLALVRRIEEAGGTLEHVYDY